MGSWRRMWGPRSVGRVEADGGFWLELGLLILLFPFRFLAGVLLAAVIHECGHLLAIGLTGGRVQRIELHAGGARILTAPMGERQELLCALAGPAAGLLTVLAWRAFPELAAAGLFQSAFNLLPIYPLDGGRAWRAARNICCKSRHSAVQ